jgi:hypothetical protein
MSQAAAAVVSAPWWGAPILAGSFAVLGVLAGQLMSWASDQRKAKREDRLRWLTDRRHVYAAYLTTLADYRKGIWSLVNKEWDINAAAKTAETIAAPRAELTLVASATVIDAVDGVLMTAKPLMYLAAKSDRKLLQDSEELKSFDQKVVELRAAARRDLGMDTADLR